MKQKLIRFIAMLIAIFLPHIFITALGNKDWMPECEKALQAHPEFVSIEGKWTNKLGEDYKINLTDGRTIGFQFINLKTGGGIYAGLVSIDEFDLSGQVKYKEEESWKDTYGYHARFQDISQLIGVKIETMVDCIDNYDKIYELAQKLAKEEYFSDYEEVVKIGKTDFENTDIVKRFPHHFVLSENRRGVVFVSEIYGYSNGLWHGVKEDEIPFNADWGENWCINKYGENWREKLNNDLPKIRKSLGLE